ncbi:divalent-cation tolerance protein CutA [Panacagrimonas sp.]|uniref:divalent-cation tolerance protein CutA n=1 Tax=Panacagrimonas sp. TaxID=2480088 RepID=UPI003B5253BE
MTDAYLMVYCTCPVDAAEALARTLVEAGAAACVNRLDGVQSTYRWNGGISTDHESLLLIKSTRAAFEVLKQTILAHHPYELPEIVAVPVATGHAPYLAWIAECVSSSA